MIVRHVSQGMPEAIRELKDRREGKFISVSTGIQKLDETMYGGIEPGRILTIGGISGHGKSTFLDQLKDNMFISAKEKNINFKLLDFSFEMLLKDNLLKLMSKRTGKSLEYLFTKYVDFTDLIQELKERPHYVVDVLLTIDQIEEILIDFCKSDDLNNYTIVTLDHTLLTKSKTTEVEKIIIDQLYNMLIRVKKKFNSEGNKVSFILLSQLNRDLESKERITNPILHYPNKNDIFAASSAYHSSDYVWMIMCPAELQGLKYYGPPLKGFPLGLPISLQDKIEIEKKRKVVYIHCIKNRFGASKKVVPLLEEYEYSRLKPIILSSETEYNYLKSV
jgi:replicative DNA helicase